MTDRELLEEILKRQISTEEAVHKTEEAVHKTEEAVHKTNLIIENQIWPAIQALGEGHAMILERIDEKIADRTEDLQDQIDVHSAAIKRLNRELRELKKAQ